MFSFADIRHIAIQIEQNGRETYLRAAAAVSDPEMAELLQRMAEDERRHSGWFAALDSERQLSDGQREMEEFGRTLLQDMVRDRTFSLNEQDLVDAKSLDDLLDQACNFEEDTILFYQMLADFVEDVTVRQQLQLIINEERQHSAELKRLRQR